MAPNLTVHVKNISAKTEEKEIHDFFSFCGKIKTCTVTPGPSDTKEATVVFEKETAARTATLLNNTQLGSAQISVVAEDSKVEDVNPAAHDRDSDEITQEQKPRARILAEYIAQGYVIGDAAIQRGLELDHKHGVSSRFMNTLQNLDQKYHATDRAKATDQNYGISQRAHSLFSDLGSYFEKATNTPTGQKLVKFYEQGHRQVMDVHSEARRLADLKKEAAGGSAYKAAGLEKVFGKEPAKPAAATSAETTPSTAPVPETAPKSSTETAAPAKPADAVPTKEPGSEKS